jgi:hypothetical protein
MTTKLMRSVTLGMLMLSDLAASGHAPPEAVMRPDMNGTRVRAPGTATVYLIDNGFRRAVPNVPAYEALFRDWECIVENVDVEAIRLGDPLGEVCCQIRSGESSGVYFVGGNTRRHVANPQVMDKYRFSWGAIRDVSCEELGRWPKGETLR